jgi:hypothetical protein
MIFKKDAHKIFFDGKNPDGDFDIGVTFKNESIIQRQKEDNIVLYKGTKNILLGYKSANSLQYGNENVIIGRHAGMNLNSQKGLQAASYNTIIGNNSTKLNVLGNANIIIGYNSCKNSTILDCNVCIGNNSDIFGYDNNLVGNKSCKIVGVDNNTFGNNNRCESTNNIIFGNNNSNINKENIIFGNNNINSGSNSLIITNNNNNTFDNYINLFDVFEGYVNDYVTVNNDFKCVSDIYSSNVYINCNLSVVDTMISSNIDISGKLVVRGNDVTEIITILDETYKSNLKLTDESVRAYLQNKNMDWVIENSQSNIYLSDFLNDDDFAPWLQSKQNQVSLNDFGGKNEFSKQYLKEIFLRQNFESDWISDIDINNFNPQNFFNNKLKIHLESISLSTFLTNSENGFHWIKNEQELVNLSLFNNDFAPWLNEGFYQVDISLSNFTNDLAPWLQYNQSDNTLSNFTNDLAPWLQ